MDPSSHSSLYSLNDALLLTDTGQQHTVSSHSGPAFNIHVLEQLQTAMNRENDRSSELEKELASCKKRLRDLEAQLQAKDDRLIKGDDLHHTHLRTVKDKLLQCLRLMNPRAAAEAAAASSSTFTPAPGDVDSLGAAAAAAASTPTRIIFEHRCDECNFRSKSDVSLILHKMNHSIVEQQFVLSTTAFTTRNSNTKAIYNCPACDSGANLTRHEVYRHIYDTHTDEKPLSCPYCEYSFTHQEYLNEHTRTKHSKANLNKNLTIRPDAQLGPLIKESWANDIIANAAQAINQGKVVNNPLNPVATTIITPSIKSLTTKTSGNRGRPSATASTKSATELKCTFIDCNFTTIFQDKLDFHVRAHINTKYKCPFCPYVSMTTQDIKRHIQKSKKHEGMKMYSCQKCGFGVDCDRLFKEHLRTFHFGFEVHDSVVDYFIEEMFINKNSKQPNLDLDLTAAQMERLKHQLQNPVLHHPPGSGSASTDGTAGGSAQHPNKKQATMLNNLMTSAQESSRKRAASMSAGVNAVQHQQHQQQQQQQLQQQLTTLIEESTSDTRSVAATPQPLTAHQQSIHLTHQQQQQQSALNSLINNYRSMPLAVGVGGGGGGGASQHSATNIVNAIGLNNAGQPVLMYHSLPDALQVGVGAGGSSSQQPPGAHAHHLHAQFHHGALQSAVTGHGGQQQQNSQQQQQQQQQQQHLTEALLLQQQRQQVQQSRGQQQQHQQQAHASSGQQNFVNPTSGDLPANLQYVTYANY